MIGAEPPTLHQREDSMNPRQHHMAGHLADRPRVVPVIGEPGIGSVPVGEKRRSGLHVGPHKRLDRSRGVVWDSRETDTSRPSIQVFRSFPPWLGLVCAAVDHLDSAGDKAVAACIVVIDAEKIDQSWSTDSLSKVKNGNIG